MRCTTVPALLISASLVAPAPALAEPGEPLSGHGDPLLSGYGNPGAAEQALFGELLAPARTGGGDGAPPGAALVAVNARPAGGGPPATAPGSDAAGGNAGPGADPGAAGESGAPPRGVDGEALPRPLAQGPMGAQGLPVVRGANAGPPLTFVELLLLGGLGLLLLGAAAMGRGRPLA